MLRVASLGAGRCLSSLHQAFGSRFASTAAPEAAGSSVSQLIASVKAAPSGLLASSPDSLAKLRAAVTAPVYSVPKGEAAMSPQLKAVLGAAGLWLLYRANAQARSHDWIVDLSLDVLQAAWLISYASFLPFRTIALSLRGLVPHTAGPLGALRPALALK